MHEEFSPETQKRLLKWAESFDDTPEDMVRRLLDWADSVKTAAKKTQSKQKGRAAPGSILAEGEYWIPILEVLTDAGGSAPANDVIDAVGPKVADRLTPADLAPLDIGEVRWRNRVRFARLRMRERGLLSDDSPRGIWALTDEGERFLNERLPS